MSSQPSFQSSQSLWPLAAPASTTSTTEDKSKKPSQRSRRKKTAAAGAQPAASTSTPTPAPPPPAQKKPKAPQQPKPQQQQRQMDLPWRGSGRGRGRGGIQLRGGAGGGGAGRGFSTFPGASSGGTSATEDVGTRVPFSRPGQHGRRPLHTDSSASTGTSLPPPVPATKSRGKKPAKGDALLKQIALKEGEEGGLNEELMRLYETQRPSREAVAARQHLIDELTQWLNDEPFRWGHPHNSHHYPLRIEPFGSVRFGLGTSSSDLDLCLLDPYRPNGFVDKFFSSQDQMLKELPDIYNMRKLGRSLQRANLSNVRSIPDASVPICKFSVEIDGHAIEVDLNTNERLGVFNSRLINSYCNLHPLVRPLSVFIKFWAKQRGLNNPSGSPTTFSSYTFILLVIAYLQRLKLLPNLQSPELIQQTNTPAVRFFSTPKARTKRYKRIIRSVGWDVTFVEYDNGPPAGYEPEPAELVQLARGFFHYWADEFATEREVVSVWNGAPLPRVREFGEVQREQARRMREKQEAMRRRAAALAGEDGQGEVSVEEEERQATEDADLAAFAAAQRPPPASEAGGAEEANLDSTDADADALDQPQQRDDLPPRPDSRSSEPMEYVDYEEPERWSDHLIVVQDPFILTRNCAGNVHPDWVEELRVQMRRARDLIDASAPLATICLNVAQEPGYLSVAARKWADRTEGKKKGMSRAERKKVSAAKAAKAGATQEEARPKSEKRAAAAAAAAEEEEQQGREELNIKGAAKKAEEKQECGERVAEKPAVAQA
ncbi:hypothetical protein JCM8097_008448 [Rhodosporidiobolus ruineniae]